MGYFEDNDVVNVAEIVYRVGGSDNCFKARSSRYTSTVWLLRIKVKRTILKRGHKGGLLISLSKAVSPYGANTTVVCDARPVRRRTDSYRPVSGISLYRLVTKGHVVHYVCVFLCITVFISCTIVIVKLRGCFKSSYRALHVPFANCTLPFYAAFL